MEPIKFIKGMNQKPDPELGEWQELTNVDCSRVGIAKSTLAQSTVRSQASLIHSMCVGSFATSESVLDGTGNRLYDGHDRIKFGTIYGIPYADTLSGEKLSSVSQNGRIYFTNPTNGLWMYNRTNAPSVATRISYKAGSYEPSTSYTGLLGGTFTWTAAATTAATGFDGTYNIVCTFVNKNGYESNPSDPITFTSTAASHNIMMNYLPVSELSYPTAERYKYSCSKRKFYIQGGTTPIYTDYVLLATVDDEDTTNYVTGITPTDVDTLTVLEEDNDVAPLLKSVVQHYDTFFGIGVPGYENYLYYSKTGKGEQWPATQAIKISRPGDYPRGLCVWDGVLWIGTPSRIYQLIGSPGSGTLSTNFYLKETRTKKGFATSNGNIPTPYGLYYMAEDGIFKFDGTESDHVSHTIQNYLDRINVSAIEETCGCYYDNKFFMSFPIDSATVNSITAIYDFETDQWMTHDVGYQAFYPDYVNNDLYVAHGTVIEKYRGATSYTNWTIKTKEFSDGPGQYTSWNEYEIDMDGSCTCNVYFDGTLVVTESLSTSGREVLTRTFPNQMARRCQIELVGTAKATQDKIYSIRISEEKIGERGEP